MRLIKEKKIGYILLWVGALFLFTAAVRQVPKTVTVSNSASGRELPIYCVETEKKVVGLSFDAAWGNDDTKRILAILEKHGINVTFFMTGGWVGR